MELCAVNGNAPSCRNLSHPVTGADPGKLQGEGHESKWCPLPIPKIKNSSDFGHLVLVVPYFQFFIYFLFFKACGGPDRPLLPLGPGRPVVPLGSDRLVVPLGSDRPVVPLGSDRPVVPLGPDRPVVPLGPDRPVVPLTSLGCP